MRDRLGLTPEDLTQLRDWLVVLVVLGAALLLVAGMLGLAVRLFVAAGGI